VTILYVVNAVLIAVDIALTLRFRSPGDAGLPR